MQAPLEITFKGMKTSEAVDAEIRDRVEKLEQFFNRITSCHVWVEQPHQKHTKGNLFDVRVVVNVPGKTLVVDRSPAGDHAHEDPYVVIRDAFDAMERQLQDYARKTHLEVKHHEQPYETGKVTKLLAYEGYGFLTTSDGREIYFDQNAVVNGNFAKIAVGDQLRFVSTMGDKGPQASTVYV